jgi:beta-galactosidase
MENWTRREFMKATARASAGLATLHAAQLPLIADQSGSSSAQPHSGEFRSSTRWRSLLDSDWRFHFGHAVDATKDFGYSGQSLFSKTGGMFEPSKPEFNLANWQTIDLPHDWAVELPFVNDPALQSHGYKPLGREFPETSIGWYRRSFKLASTDGKKRLSLQFDGVFRDSVVVLNGIYLGRHESGYVPFSYAISDFVNYGGENVIVVRADATLGEGWWYEGAGIYRHVWLNATDDLHVAPEGLFARSNVQSGAADVHISTEVENDSDRARSFRLRVVISDPNGTGVTQHESNPVEIAGRSRALVEQTLSVKSPALWSLEHPNLYRATAVIEADEAEVDHYATTFGIRTIEFDAKRGFFLNGQPVKIKGTCNHQDFAGVGTALPDRIHEYRVQKLKEMGSNAYRMSHNPPAPALLDVCDRLGMLVLDETRMMSSSAEGLRQMETIVRRDRNHPSIFMWSVGNEESEVQGNATGRRIATSMRSLIRKLDPTRTVTEAMNDSWGKGLSAVVDVQGFNYHTGENMDAFHSQFPEQPTIGTETGSTVSTRGIYANDKRSGYVSAYDVNVPEWAQLAEYWWKVYAEREYVAGGFAWTGFDYRGEPTPYSWPCINSHFGIMDMCGFPKDNYFYYQAQWLESPVLHLFPHWNWHGSEGRDIDVWCHSNMEQVELLVNGKTLGRKSVPRYGHVEWKVPYVAGRVEARGYRGGNPVISDVQQTTGPAARLMITADRRSIQANGCDVSLLHVQALDSAGLRVPTAVNDVRFETEGGGRLIGVGNGDPSSHEADKADRRRLFSGSCLAILQSGTEAGDVKVEASSPGLQPANTTIQTERVQAA